MFYISDWKPQRDIDIGHPNNGSHRLGSFVGNQNYDVTYDS